MELNLEAIWEKICFVIDKYKLDSEAKLQSALEDSVLPSSNWEECRGDVERPTVQFGSAHSGKPDAILKKDGKYVVAIELKRPVLKFRDENERQLFSYMESLKLKFGILLGESIRIYYDNIVDQEPPRLIKTINLLGADKDGIELIKHLHKNNFSEHDFEEYCKKLIKEKESLKENNRSVDYLCSDAGLEYIKDLLRIEYSDDVIDKLNISVTSKDKKISINSSSVEKSYNPPIEAVTDVHYQKKNGESVQDWYKRILKTLYLNNRLSEDQIAKLHDKQYSKNNFNINYPILCDTNAERYSADGQARYYTEKDKVGEKYYICHELCNTWKYEKPITEWLNNVLNG